MRNLPALLEAELQGAAYGICRLVKITRKSGAVLRIAEHQQDMVVEGDTYVRARGFRCSSLPFRLNSSSTSTSFEIVAVDGGLIDPDDLRNGLYDTATVVISAASHLVPGNGKIDLFRGNFGDITLTDVGLAQIRVTGLFARADQLLIEHYSPMCRTEFGDARCKVPLGPLTQSATVVSVSGFNIVISGSAAGRPDDYWNLGLVMPTSGPGVGDGFEIRDWSTGSNVIKTYLPPVGKLYAGDSVNLIPGCDFTRSETTGCGRYNNIINYRGEPYVPGQDANDITYSDWGTTT
jgi:uncharacterized phage protein (TIGR02218 family)